MELPRRRDRNVSLHSLLRIPFHSDRISVEFGGAAVSNRVEIGNVERFFRVFDGDFANAEPMWQLELGGGGSESYPERPDEADCIYYLRTGFCGYGARCRFNHPRDRNLVMGALRAGGEEFPERVGQPICQYYLRTGMCTFGASCKHHHPRQGGGAALSVTLNISGYPLRPGEKECSSYVKTGQCKFGVSCKFDHPQPGGIQIPAPTVGHLPMQAPVPPSAMYPRMQSNSAGSSQQYGVVTGNWPVARPTLVPGSYLQGAYSPVLFPPGMVPFPGYQASVSPVAPPTSQPAGGAASLYGLPQLSPPPPAYAGAYLPLPAPPGPSSSSQTEQSFPERPGQPECQYYMRTGDCKFGSSCRYHHPPEWGTPRANFSLSPMGLPLCPSVKEKILRDLRRDLGRVIVGDDDFQKIKEPKRLEAHCRAEINMDIQRPYTASELVESREDLISQNLHQLNLGEISRQRKLDGLSEDNNMVKQEAGSASSRNQTTSSRNRTGFGLNRLLFGITKKGRSKYTSPKEELMVLDETGNKSESVQTVDKWTEGASSSLNPWDNSSSCMSENITGTSPEKERFEDELKEAHSLLLMDDDLVLFMDTKPFCLHILDLSGTSISNLPKCISELVTLESLTLRDCILLMELPPEIGELTNLKLLDLLGTEVVCLPKEIAKLVSLRSFRIALCGYADHFKESRGIDSVIPRNALSKLSNLSDFRIHVNPDGIWWDVEVKAVIEDLHDLENLRTLHLDLPKVDLLDDLMRSINQLQHLSSLCFRLTVGRHEERIIHRLPQHVEKEFHDLERFEKGVKYTNSEGIPVEIKNALNHADAFLLERHWSVKNLLEFGVENMNELKCCILLECNELQTVVDAEECKDFDGSILGSLECLSIHYMKKMERIWKGPVMKGSLSNMKSLALHTCVSLTTVFTLNLLSNLMNLEELTVEDCPKIKTLVSSNSPNLIRKNFLPKLKTMLLLELPNLGCISSGLTIAPKLERLVIFYCPKLDKLSPVEISSRVLKVIKGEKRWWDALKWYESGATEEEQEYLAGKFVPLRKDEDLEEQFMRD